MARNMNKKTVSRTKPFYGSDGKRKHFENRLDMQIYTDERKTALIEGIIAFYEYDYKKMPNWFEEVQTLKAKKKQKPET